MAQQSSRSNLCESAAHRIQSLLDKDKEEMLLLRNPELQSQAFCKKYKCDLVKPPRILPQMDHLSLQGYLLVKGKKQIKSRHVTQGDPIKPLLISVDGSGRNEMIQETGQGLSPTRVAACKYKEHFLVSKRLKNISHSKTGGPKRHQVVPIQSASADSSTQNSFHDYRQFKEERHFQIGRVINYFVD